MESIRLDCDSCVTSFVKELKELQSKLTNEQEIMLIINGLTFRLEKLQHNHNTLIYYRSTVDNLPVVCVQHYHQLSVSFFAAAKRNAEEKAVRIGFL